MSRRLLIATMLIGAAVALPISTAAQSLPAPAASAGAGVEIGEPKTSIAPDFEGAKPTLFSAGERTFDHRLVPPSLSPSFDLSRTTGSTDVAAASSFTAGGVFTLVAVIVIAYWLLKDLSSGNY